MALFGRKKKTVSCAICGAEAKTGLFRGLFQQEIEGQYVCDDCYGVVHLPGGMVNRMTLGEFKNYMAFREENQKLKSIFQITEQVDFGIMDSKFLFDMSNRLLCLDKHLNSTIFEARQIKSFTIKEDEHTIFLGTRTSLVRNESTIPSQVRSMAPQIRSYQLQLQRYQDRLNNAPEEKKEEIRRQKPLIRIDEPFRNFHVEIHLDHPYWEVITADMSAPNFNDNKPDIHDYLNSYNKRYSTMEQLANALTALAFPGAQDADESIPAAAAAVPVDAVNELKRYKELLDMGIITNEEFTAKKRQLLGL